MYNELHFESMNEPLNIYSILFLKNIDFKTLKLKFLTRALIMVIFLTAHKRYLKLNVFLGAIYLHYQSSVVNNNNLFQAQVTN